MDNQKWASICEYVVWFYQMTSYIRYDPSERLAKASRFLDAKHQIKRGSRPESVRIPGIGTDWSPAQSHTAAQGEFEPGSTSP